MLSVAYILLIRAVVGTDEIGDSALLFVLLLVSELLFTVPVGAVPDIIFDNKPLVDEYSTLGATLTE